MSQIFVQLGRAGDLLSLLPLLHHEWKSTSIKPRVMVSNEFASVLEGCSYVEPVIFDGHHFEIEKAMELAKAMADEVVCTQVIGPKEVLAKYQRGNPTTSFQKDQWQIAGKKHLWDECLPLVLDQRDSKREKELLRKSGVIHRGHKKPLIVIALGGITSPFPYADLLRELVTLKFGESHEILELPKAERIYDLLAIYERAALLIADDSAPLHLAWATRGLPVFALAQDRPSLWHGASWKPNHQWYCRYRDFPERALEMCAAMTTVSSDLQFDSTAVFSAYESDERFFQNASKLPIQKGMCGRDSLAFDGAKRVPHLKDVLRMAMQRGRDEMLIILTRNGVEKTGSTNFNGPWFSYRLNCSVFKEGEGFIRQQEFRPVGDAFCATKAWWKSILSEIPDLFLSNDYQWSEALVAIFRAHGAKDQTGVCTFVKPADAKAWNGAESKVTKHNRELCFEVLKRLKVHSRYPKISEQLPTRWMVSDKLPRFHYNPSILQVQGRTLFTYRHHPDPTSPVTRLGLAELSNRDFSVFNAGDLSIPGPAQDDGRLFALHDEPWMSWVEAMTYKIPVKAVMKYGKLLHKKREIERIYQPKFGGNDGTGAQKNWCFFEWNNCLFCIYRSDPVYTVLQIQGETNVHEYQSDAPRWPYGEIRGGNIVKYGSQLLRFFHSRLSNDLNPAHPHRYFVGALLMESTPPFKVTRVSRKPILYGSEIDGLKPADRAQVPFRFPNLVFPCGAITHGDGWIVSVGVNHAQSALVTVTEKDLNL